MEILQVNAKAYVQDIRHRLMCYDLIKIKAYGTSQVVEFDQFLSFIILYIFLNLKCSLTKAYFYRFK